MYRKFFADYKLDHEYFTIGLSGVITCRRLLFFFTKIHVRSSTPRRWVTQSNYRECAVAMYVNMERKPLQASAAFAKHLRDIPKRILQKTVVAIISSVNSLVLPGQSRVPTRTFFFSNIFSSNCTSTSTFPHEACDWNWFEIFIAKI